MTKLIKNLKEDLKQALIRKKDMSPCQMCIHYVKCSSDCPNWESGTEGYINDKLVNMKWTCQDFEYGTCGRLENTICNKCFHSTDYEGWEYNVNHNII